MTPLPLPDIVLIVATVAASALLIAAVAAVLLHLLRRRSVVVSVIIASVAATATVGASTAAIAIEMYLSAHDLAVLVWVVASGTLSAVIVALALAARLRRSLRRLTESVDRIGEGEQVTVLRDLHGLELIHVSAELANMSHRLHAARMELERIDSERRRFLAWISHDLRTPLSAVHALTESAQLGLLNDEDTVTQVRRHTERMGRMLDDIFDLSRLTSGSLRLRPEQVSVRDIISDCVAGVSALAADRGIRIATPDGADHLIWADPHELARALLNLLGNAVRYAPAQSTVLVSAVATTSERLTISVLDHGGGVAIGDLDRMFDVGWRADTARSTDTGRDGSGLGLAIVRGIAVAHGGSATAEHTPEGFRVSVELPVTARPSGTTSTTAIVNSF